MAKPFIAFLMIFFILPLAYADISIKTEQQSYNLGDKIKAFASILEDKSFEGLLKLTLLCADYKLEYFLTPISLESNFRTAVTIPDLAVTGSMLGNCSITGNLLTNDNLLYEKKESDKFSVTSLLKILPVRSITASLPGESIEIAGVVNDAFGSNVLKNSVKITLDNNSKSIETTGGKFNLTLQLQKNIKSGKHIIEIASSDSKGNAGESSIELDIIPVPSLIKMDLSGHEFAPGSKMQITAYLYDQSDDLVNDSIQLELNYPNGNKVFEKTLKSNEKIDYEFGQYTEPGRYTLTAAYKNLLDKDFVNITKVREVKIKYENETVLLENTGNIPYEDELTFIIESELKKYPITKKIKVDPSKFISFDLSKEVPLGNYNVIIPIKEKIKDAIESAQEKLSDLLQEQNNVLASNVTIHDNRPVYKKIESGLSFMSGNLIGSDGILSKNPIVAPLILVIIIILLVFRYGRKPIMKLIKRDKDEEDKDEKGKN